MRFLLFLILIIHDVDFVACTGLSDTSWDSWEVFLEILFVQEVPANGPASFSLPPIVIYDTMGEVLVYPPDSVWVAPLTDQMEALQGRYIKIFYVVPVVVFLFDYSHSCGGHVDGLNFVLLHYFPEDAGVRDDGLPFKDN